MNDTHFKVYGYRWVVLVAFAIINAIVQLNWIVFAPITVDCITLYNKSAFWIVLLSMSFMVVYIFVSVPASYIIDRYGIRIGVGIGAVLTGVFGYLRGVYADDYTMIALSQFALAVAQPFILNAITKVAAEWFPINERATASGITVLAQFIGIIIAMALTKPLAQSFMAAGASARLDMPAVQGMLNVYGIASVVSAVIFLLLVRDKPPTPPCSDVDSERFSVTAGIQHMFKQKDMLLLLVIFFVGMGIFNTITTFIDLLLATKGFAVGGNEAGNVGAIMMITGILGAIVIPPLSDRFRMRKAFFILCAAGLFPGLLGLTFCTGYVPLLISSAIFGFFFMAAAPLGYQYAAEVSHPAPETASQGMIVLAGQISGTIFITLMALLGNISIEALADATRASNEISLTPFMVGFIALSVLNIVLGFMLKESRMIKTS
jgi:MFS family permease